MARIISLPEEKHVNCESCKATIAYLPEDHVEIYRGKDLSGGPDGYKRIKCPRAGCPGYGYIERW